LIDESTRWGAIGDASRGLAAAEEALDMARDLHKKRPKRMIELVSQALAAVASRLAESERPADALPKIQEALTLLGWPDHVDQRRSGHRVGGLLRAYGARLRDVGQLEESLTYAQSGVAAFRGPRSYSRDGQLAMSLGSLSETYAAMEQMERALSASSEAIALWRHLDAESATPRSGWLGQTLLRHAELLTRMGDEAATEAVSTAREAKEHLTIAMESNPERHAKLLSEASDLLERLTL
jgi:tetratricopeptide (TPR) repeat protein